MMELQGVKVSAPAVGADEVFSVLGSDGSADPVTDPHLDRALVRDLYRAMVRTRVIDQQLEKLQRQGRIGFHIGSYGEEATILGSAAAARPQDWLFPCYREFGALLWRGMPLQTYLDNMFGNADDLVRGRQMPDHYSGKPYKFGSVSSPIGTQISQAMGFSWAAKLKHDDLVALAYMGEGATSSNDFHTGLNFAGVFKTPTVFLVRNNRWAISVPASRQSATRTFAEKAVAYGLRAARCDGNDILATYRTVREAVERAAAGEGATLVELVTYRLGGHSTSDDPRAYRAEAEVAHWREADPLPRTRAYLTRLGAWTDADEAECRAEIEQELRQAIELAEKKPAPPLETMFDDVYATRPWHLEEQRATVLGGPRAKGHH